MSIFKNSFDPIIKDQLHARGKAIKDRTKDSISFFNGRNAWVRMTSGVDINGSESLALHNIMQGGTLENGHIQFGLESNDNFGAYNRTVNSFNGEVVNLQNGIRPMPGIISVDVTSKSAYGSLRVASVKFICHDVRQLEVLELLYMRPGFTCLLEFGWAPYLDNNGKASTEIDFYGDMFSKNKETLQSRFKNLFEKAKQYYGNYDAVLGYIKNYSWSARMDGSFDCSIDIISIGEIMESLKINYAAINIPITEQGLLLPKQGFKEYESFFPKLYEQYGEDIRKFHHNGILAGILSELIFLGYSVKTKSEKGNIIKIFDVDGSITGPKNKGFPFEIFVIDIENGSVEPDDDNNISSTTQVFITLETFVDLLNTHVIVHDKTNSEPLIPISLQKDGEDLLCLSYPLQISVDPNVCLIKNNFYQKLNNILISTAKPNTIYPPPATTIRGIADRYMSQIAAEYDKHSNIDEDVIVTILNGYFEKVNLQKYSIYEAGSFLADAFEQYKVLNAKVVKSETGNNILKYSIGNIRNLDDSANKTSKTDLNKDIINITFYQVLVDDLYNFNDDSLKKFVSNPIFTNSIKTSDGRMTPEVVKDFASKLFTGDAGIQSTARDSLRTQFETIKSNELNKDISEKSSKNLTFLQNLPDPSYFVTTNNDRTFGSFKGIWVNLKYALSLASSLSLENADPREKKEINLYDYIKSLMRGIQETIGGLNDFQIHVDPIDHIARIIDINYIDKMSANEAFENAFTFLSPNDLNYDGLYNNIRSYKMSSQIFKEQATIVAISAQNGGGQMGLDNDSLVGWNSGITDRLLPDKGAPYSPSSVTEEGKADILSGLTYNLSILKEFINDLGYYHNLGFGTGTGRIFQSDKAERYKNALRDLIIGFKSLDNSTAHNKSPIPTKLSIELDGIGGLIIGHIFRMPEELIPMGYKYDNNIGRKLGYIVTGIAHSITNDWVTRIEGQTIILEDDENSASIDVITLLDAATDNAAAPKTIFKISTGTNTSIYVLTDTNRVGAEAYPGPPDFAGKYGNALIPISALTPIQSGAARKEYNNQYLLHPEAATHYLDLKRSAESAGFSSQITVTSAYRDLAHQRTLIGNTARSTIASAGYSAHGTGGAIDIGYLYTKAGGSGNPALNKVVRDSDPFYQWMSTNGPKFGWFNPYRLANGTGVDECWHWEYYGFWTLK